jgi:hypothetical protein
MPLRNRQALQAAAFLIAAGGGGAAIAQPVNEAPPPGAILDLAGSPINQGSPVEYSVSFTATQASTDISFAFRDDPAFLSFSNASVVAFGGTTNLLTNGNFLGGTYSNGANGSIPNGWTFQNQFGASYEGMVQNGVWLDGSVQAYDSLSQYISTVIGDTYTISFFLTENNASGDDFYQDISTNGDDIDTGGNGIDVLTYATANFNINVPEPASVLILGVGLVGVAATRRRQAI